MVYIHQLSSNHLEEKRQNGGNNLYFILGSLYMNTSCLVLLNKVPQNVYIPIVGSVDAPGSVYVPKVFLYHTPVLPVRYRVIVLSL